MNFRARIAPRFPGLNPAVKPGPSYQGGQVVVGARSAGFKSLPCRASWRFETSSLAIMAREVACLPDTKFFDEAAHGTGS